MSCWVDIDAQIGRLYFYLWEKSHAVRMREHEVTDNNKLIPLLPLGIMFSFAI